ncbi:hypothetical protein FOVG_19801 [Fusarium oxysporum f. sp. pisi HDV247]|uniref:Uncharacterized protein n=1 Tax=Fusarium oxysporum f. sp. pisi HDV247 TaxID=1080344 RepID=W9NF47_FUSOX|nr:hypothetical protein FOVG_19801 [Fusarium oxysporum f. sp. pisi HDV247]
MIQGSESSSPRRKITLAARLSGPVAACGCPTISSCRELASKIAKNKPPATSMLWRNLHAQVLRNKPSMGAYVMSVSTHF